MIERLFVMCVLCVTVSSCAFVDRLASRTPSSTADKAFRYSNETFDSLNLDYSVIVEPGRGFSSDDTITPMLLAEPKTPYGDLWMGSYGRVYGLTPNGPALVDGFNHSSYRLQEAVATEPDDQLKRITTTNDTLLTRMEEFTIMPSEMCSRYCEFVTDCQALMYSLYDSTSGWKRLDVTVVKSGSTVVYTRSSDPNNGFASLEWVYPSQHWCPES